MFAIKQPSKIIYGKNSSSEYNFPEKSLLILDELGKKFSNETSVLVARGNSHILLQEFDIALEYYQKALEKNPEHKSALTNMILLAKQTSDPILAETYLVKLLGKNPTPSELDPEKGNMPYTMRINDSNIYSATMQMQVRDSSDNLVAIVESEKILYIPHPLMYEIIAFFLFKERFIIYELQSFFHRFRCNGLPHGRTYIKSWTRCNCF